MGFRHMREMAGLSVLYVANELGVSDAAVYMWETGQMMPKASRLRAIAELYCCSVDELLREEGITNEL